MTEEVKKANFDKFKGEFFNYVHNSEDFQECRELLNNEKYVLFLMRLDVNYPRNNDDLSKLLEKIASHSDWILDIYAYNQLRIHKDAIEKGDYSSVYNNLKVWRIKGFEYFLRKLYTLKHLPEIVAKLEKGEDLFVQKNEEKKIDEEVAKEKETEVEKIDEKVEKEIISTDIKDGCRSKVNHKLRNAIIIIATVAAFVTVILLYAGKSKPNTDDPNKKKKDTDEKDRQVNPPTDPEDDQNQEQNSGDEKDDKEVSPLNNPNSEQNQEQSSSVGTKVLKVVGPALVGVTAVGSGTYLTKELIKRGKSSKLSSSKNGNG